MTIKKVILLILMIFIIGKMSMGQNYCPYTDLYCDYAPLDTVFIRDTVYISNLEEITRKFGMTFNEYMQRFMKVALQEGHFSDQEIEQIYFNYFLPVLKNHPDFMTKHFIAIDYELFFQNKEPQIYATMVYMPDSSLKNRLNMDVMFTCVGDLNTDMFIKSPYYMQDAFIRILKDIETNDTLSIKGIHFYFPDFSFKEKRAMAQFAKSISLVIDSSHIEKIKKLRLYFTFNQNNAQQQENYLYGLSIMTDSVFILRTENTNRSSLVAIYTPVNADTISVFSKILNQFYLARFNLQDFPKTNDTILVDHDIKALMQSDFPDNNWEIYLFCLIGIVFLVIVFFILYSLIPAFSTFINQNQDFYMIGILMLFMEIILLLLKMFENMSRDQIFTVSEGKQNYLLLFPLLFVFTLPIIKLFNKRKATP
ncbi:MAG: hypothetical protein RR034_04440 [Bacteroidales bacterium]